jgi:hypothetical protein
MSSIGKHKLVEALSGQQDGSGGRRRLPKGTGRLKAEQLREASESRKAENAQGAHRDRMVEIGRAGQQAGRG